VNKLAPYLLVASLAFFGGRISVEGFSFDFGSIVAPQKQEIGTIAVIEEVTDRAKIVAKMVAAGWFSDQQAKGIVCNVWDDEAKAVESLKTKVDEVGGVAAIAVLGTEKQLLGIRKLNDNDSIDDVEKWIQEVGKYGN